MTNTVRKQFFLLSAILLLLLCLSNSRAGTGSIDPAAGVVNLSVSVRYDATPEELEGWRANLQDASSSLFDATDGQVRLGTIEVFCNSSNGTNADIYFHDGSGRASANVYNPGWLGIGRHGLGGSGHVYCFESSDGWTFAHEFGHYIFGVYDEYADVGGISVPRCQGYSSSIVSIMEAVGREEFCVASNHDSDHDTEQHNHHHESCWETINRYYPWITMPVISVGNPDGLPVVGPTNPGALTWILRDCHTRTVLCLDRSGSMDGAPIEAARIAAKLTALLVETGSSLSVVSFSTSAQVNFGMQEVGGILDRGPILAAIGSITAGGNTSFGAGLNTSLAQITGQGAASSSETIIFMSDGYHNTAPDVNISALQSRGVQVYTLGFGSNPDNARLQSIANATGGAFYSVPFGGLRSVPYPDDIASTMANILADATEIGTVDRASEDLDVGEEEQWPARIEEGAEWVDFVINWNAAAGRINMSLITPSGVFITPTDAISYVEDSASGFAFYRIASPESGLWTMVVSGDELTQATNYRRQVRIRNPKVGFAARAIPDVVVPVDSVVITAMLEYQVPITDVAVTAEIVTPGGQINSITLFDDGSPYHGDMEARDGEFSILYHPPETGAYNVYLHAENMGSAEYVSLFREPLQEGDPGVSMPPIPLFRRFATLSFIGDATVQPVCECNVEYLDEEPGRWGYRLTNEAVSTCEIFDLTIDTECDGIDTCLVPDGWTFHISGQRVTFTASTNGVPPGSSLDGFVILARSCATGSAEYRVGIDFCTGVVPGPCCWTPIDICNSDEELTYKSFSLMPPTLVAKQDSGSIILHWNKTPATDFYQIYRGPSPDQLESVGFTLDSVWTDSMVTSLVADRIQFYQVVAKRTEAITLSEPASEIAFWPFEEGFGDFSEDLGDHGHHATLYDAEWVNHMVDVYSCWAVHFDHLKYVEIPNSDDFYPEKFQVDVRFKVDYLPAGSPQIILGNSRYGPVNGGFALRIQPDGQLLSITWDGSKWTNLMSTVPVPIDQWITATLIVDGYESLLLIDGVVVSAGNLEMTTANNNMPLTIGASGLPGGSQQYHFRGDIAWLKMTELP